MLKWWHKPRSANNHFHMFGYVTYVNYTSGFVFSHMWQVVNQLNKRKSKVQSMTSKPKCCVMDHNMWNSMEAKVNGLVASTNEITKLFLMNRGGIGPSGSNNMFITTVVEGANMVRDASNSLKDIALTLVPKLANITPTLLTLMIKYKGPHLS